MRNPKLQFEADVERRLAALEARSGDDGAAQLVDQLAGIDQRVTAIELALTDDPPAERGGKKPSKS